MSNSNHDEDSCERSNIPSSEEEELLRREVQRLKKQLEQLSSSSSSLNDATKEKNNIETPQQQQLLQKQQQSFHAPEKSGYLYKWADRSIGWGGSKWGLRFVRLEHGHLSYFKSHEDKSPRYILTLKNCAVRDEGSKVNKRHVGFGSSAGGASLNRSENEKSDIISSKTMMTMNTNPNEGNNNEHCSENVVTITSTPTTGSHYHVFSIYHRPSATTASTNDSMYSNKNEENDVMPLLRFSTQSYAEKLQWIHLISQSCAYCDSEEFAIFSAQLQQQQSARKAHSQHHQRGTLPPLIFESAPSYPPRTSGHIRKHSLTGVSTTDTNTTSTTMNYLDGKGFRSKSSAKDAARTNNISYPPSKPMHRQASSSYLANDGGNEDAPNYHGFFNLLLIILLVSNFRLLLDTVSRHGFILHKIPSNPLEGFSQAPLDFPFLSGLLLVQAFVVGTYLIEKIISRGWFGNHIGLLLHFVNTNASLGTEMAIVWYLIENPVIGAILILQATITWLKLISYVHANYDYRTMSRDKHQAMLALVKDLDPEDTGITYPQNVTFGDIYYFWAAPTLTYQIAFPRSPIIRWTRVLTLSIHLVISSMLVIFLAAQVVSPNLDNLVSDLESNRGELRTHVIGNYLLKLSISSTYIWLLVFYLFFHCFMNLTAEMLRFGDRVFYRDWWNASEVSAYWRLWNMPVHYWLVRHVYFPAVRLGFSKNGATFMVFLFSAVLHEILISVPCHMLRVYSFLAMMGQIPLIFLTKILDRRYPGSSIGNFIFWISFCFVGQPMAILLYTIDYWEINHKQDDGGQKMNWIDVNKIFGTSDEL